MSSFAFLRGDRSLVHPVYTPDASEICFIVKDPQRTMKDYLAENGSCGVTKVRRVGASRAVRALLRSSSIADGWNLHCCCRCSESPSCAQGTGRSRQRGSCVHPTTCFSPMTASCPCCRNSSAKYFSGPKSGFLRHAARECAHRSTHRSTNAASDRPRVSGSLAGFPPQ